MDLRTVEPELRHDLARRRDLRFRDAPIGLGHVSHDFERGLEKAHADLERIDAGSARARGNTLIIEMTEHQADEQAPRASKQQQTQNRAN